MSATVNEKILNALNMYNEGLQEKISENYVEKELGKGLSTNDFTTAEKEKLGGLSNFDPETLSDTYATKSTIAGLSSVYVEKDGNKVLSTNDFTDAEKTKLGGLSNFDPSTLSDTYVQKVAGKGLSENDFTDDYKTAIDGLSSTYATKSEISTVYKAKGSVADSSFLPTNAEVGDVYNLLAAGGVDEKGIAFKAGDNAVWTGTGWDNLGGTIDLTGYVQKVSGKDLSSNDFTTAYKNTLDNLGSTYVQKVQGKVLSSNDFTDDYKTAIDGLSSAGSNFDPETLSDTYVLQVTGKGLSTNDFTDADKTKLDNLPNISLFMKALLETNDATEARALLKVAREDFFDETGNRWNSTNAYLSTDAKKFGSRSMHTNGNGYLTLPTPFALGGKDFAISFWFKPTLTSKLSTMLAFRGTNASTAYTIARLNASNHFQFLDTISSSNKGSYVGTSAISESWHHFELNFKKSTNWAYVFLDGTKILDYNASTTFGTVLTRPLFLGYSNNSDATAYFTGYIDEFLLTQKLLHTANFTPPTDPHSADSDTLALLHFE